MHDQAHELRSWIQRGLHDSPAPEVGPVLIALAGAKGGVGTTTLALQLALELTRGGQRCAVVDTVLDGPDLAMIAGVNDEQHLGDVLVQRRELKQVLVEGPEGVLIACGERPRRTHLEPSESACQHLIDQLRRLDRVDIVLLDLGRGYTRLAQRLATIADRAMLVTTADDVALLDAYGLLKSWHRQQIAPPLSLILNRLDSRVRGIEAVARLAQTAQRFLAVSLESAANVPIDEGLASIAQRRSARTADAFSGLVGQLHSCCRERATECVTAMSQTS